MDSYIAKLNDTESAFKIIPKLKALELEKIISYLNDQYYTQGISLIPDQIYDVLLEKLKLIKPNSKLLKSVGSEITGNKVKLPYWMGSMEKIKTDANELQQWLEDYTGPYLVSEKLDGISGLIVNKRNKVKLYTRGDGSYGRDISHLIEYLNVGELPNNTAVRGEIIMSKKNFSKFASKYSNARNMVGGLINSKVEKLNKNEIKYVEFVAYELYDPIMKLSDGLKEMREWGFKVVKHQKIRNMTLDYFQDLFVKFKETSEYEIDGLIISDDNVHEKAESGNPTYSFAYKGPNEQAETIVTNVKWTPSKDGYLIPTIQFETVKLSQVNINNTSGFNAKFIVENNICPGSKIIIIRSGDVIPYILHVTKSSKRDCLPDNYDYQWDKNEVHIILTNPDDDETVVVKRITKFFKGIGVDNLSTGNVTKIVNQGYDDIIAILKMDVDDFMKVEGFQKKMSQKLYDNIQEAIQDVPLYKFIEASNLLGRGMGEKKIKKLLNAYPNIMTDFKKADSQKWIDQISGVTGFDTLTAELIVSNLPEFIKFYKKVSKYINITQPKKKSKKQRFAGMKIVFTGFRNETWKNIIEEEGGDVLNSISSKTSIVVYKSSGDKKTGKIKASEEKGITTMSMEEFEKKFFS